MFLAGETPGNPPWKIFQKTLDERCRKTHRPRNLCVFFVYPRSLLTNCHCQHFHLSFLKKKFGHCYFEAFMGRFFPLRDLVNFRRHLKLFDHHLCCALLLKRLVTVFKGPKCHVSPTGWDDTTSKGEHSYLKHLNPQKLT